MSARVVVDLLSYTGTKGGMETYTRELYRELGALGRGYTFVGYCSREAFGMDLTWFPGKTVDSGISGENRIGWARGELFAVSRFARRVRADLIHCPATLGPWRSTVPVVVTMHDMLYWSHPELMSTPIYTAPVKWMERRVSAAAQHIITDSQFSKDEIVAYLGVPPEKVSVVLLAGTAHPRATTTSDVRESRHILAVGNRRPHKNFARIIEALALIPEQVRPQVTITGSRGDDPLAPVVERLGVEQWVDLRSWVSDEELEDLFRRCTCLIMPSICEGFGLPVLDAMAVGMPVIISDIPVYREVAGDNAIYVDPFDVDSMAHGMTRACTDPALLAQLSADGVTHAATFTWHKTATATADAFARVLSRR